MVKGVEGCGLDVVGHSGVACRGWLRGVALRVGQRGVGRWWLRGGWGGWGWGGGVRQRGEGSRGLG